MSAATPEELFANHQKWAEGVAKSCLKHLPPSFEFDDLKQVALIALWGCCKKYDASLGVPFLAYSHTYVQSACWMLVRRRSYTEATHAELPEVIEAPAAKRPDVQAEARIKQEELHGRLECLNAQQRAVIEALFWEGVSLIALSRRLGCSVQVVQTRRKEAFEEIRRHERQDSSLSALRKALGVAIAEDQEKAS